MFRLPLPRRRARVPLRVKGASTPEMGLLLGLVAVLAIVAVTVTGTEISRIFGLSGDSLASVALRSETPEDPSANPGTSDPAPEPEEPADMPPVVSDDTVGPAFINQAYLLDAAELLANDHDPEGQPLTVVSVENDVGGNVSLSDTTISFTPSVPYGGTARFFYTARDAAGSEATALVTVTVGNTPPVAADDTDTIEIEAGTPKTIAAADLLANDSDADGHTLEIESVSLVSVGGNAQLSPDRQSVTFTPTGAADAPWSFTYTINDGYGAKATATVSGTILPAPIGWVGVGNGATFNSPDGITWSATAASGLTFNGLTVANGALLAVGNGGLARRSVDGTTWDPIPGFSSTQTFRDIASSGSRVVVVGGNGWTGVSTDGGESWTFTQNLRNSGGIIRQGSGITWNGALFVAVGQDGNIWTSTDGVNWALSTSPVTDILRSVAWTGSQFVAVGDDGAIVTSPDGITWQERTNGAARYTTRDLQTVASDGATIVAAGANGTVVVSTDAGSTWTATTCGLSAFNGSGHDGKKFVLAGINTSCYSSDGIVWTQGTLAGGAKAIVPFAP